MDEQAESHPSPKRNLNTLRTVLLAWGFMVSLTLMIAFIGEMSGSWRVNMTIGFPLLIVGVLLPLIAQQIPWTPPTKMEGTGEQREGQQDGSDPS